MKNTKAEQLIWLIVATLFTAGMIYFVSDSTVVMALASTFTGIVGIFLGLDIATMIRKTNALPGGEYKAINKHRYIASLIIFSFLMIEAFIISGVFNRNCDSLYASFGMGFLIVVGGLIAGVEGNKMATGKKRIPPDPLKTCDVASQKS
jgi:glucan phosphoethanolaminetransferase (alkaline phosphatase superfamily)